MIAIATLTMPSVDLNIRIDYASMQASGMVMDHTQDCDRYAQLANAG